MGLIQAMGYTFIALQGFDLIAAVGGEVRQPDKNLPRAIIISLLIALACFPAPAQEPIETDLEEQVEVNLVLIDAVVVDGNPRPAESVQGQGVVGASPSHIAHGLDVPGTMSIR